MAFVSKILSKFLGNKSDKDIREIMPIIQQIHKEYDRIKVLSNDDLRGETFKLKEGINEHIRPEKEEIDALKVKVEEVDIEESEKIYDQIDKNRGAN